MIINYIKLALRGMLKRKFFTFISLFGISFTLGILMVVLSFIQSELGENAPLSQKNDFILVEQFSLKKVFMDTIIKLDTIIENGFEVIDTTYEYKEKGTGMSTSEINSDLIKNYLSDISSSEYSTIFNNSNSHDVYVNGVKLSLDILLADANYWKVFDHKILEGRSINDTDVEIGANVIVISTKTAMDYFGQEADVIGKEMFIDGKTFEVIGLYEHMGKVRGFVSPDAVSPYTIISASLQKSFYFGAFSTVFKKKSQISADVIKEEIRNAAKIIPIDHPDNEYGFDTPIFKPKTYNEMFAQGIYYEEDASKSLKIMSYILISLLLFFVLLPTLNLINLNVSRIIERSSEIGVRKAFGAHRGNIIYQFIIENIVQTIIGALIGLLLATILINVINEGGLLEDAKLMFNWKFFIYSFLVALFFGILSGFLPAYKMSKLQIVNALKENRL